MNIMKRLFLLFSFVVVTQFANAQKVISVNYQNQADIKVFVVDYANQADLKVFKVDYRNQAKGNKGLWFFTEYLNQANKTVFFVDYQNQADLKIFFVSYLNQAGWVNHSKKQLLY
jgi:hypothetical protein